RAAIREHPPRVGGVAGAGAKVQCRDAPAPPGGLPSESLDVDRVRAALQPVEEDQAGSAAALALHVIEHELVAVRRLEQLTAEADETAAAGEASPDRLNVRPGNPPGRTEVLRIQGAGWTTLRFRQGNLPL